MFITGARGFSGRVFHSYIGIPEVGVTAVEVSVPFVFVELVWADASRRFTSERVIRGIESGLTYIFSLEGTSSIPLARARENTKYLLLTYFLPWVLHMGYHGRNITGSDNHREGATERYQVSLAEKYRL